ncbi:MAG TPA: L,D-transpeptidase [Pseudolabrys sp.]|nr:L,D-transpeptidase [Pseudolabrys sp.]
MWRSIALGLAAVFFSNVTSAEPLSLAPPNPGPQTPPMIIAAAQTSQAQPNFGGGFFEFLFGDSSQQNRRPAQEWYGAPPRQDDYGWRQQEVQPTYGYGGQIDPMLEQRQHDGRMNPRYFRQEVTYDGRESPGTLVIDTPNHFLYLVEPNGRAIRYGIGVGRPGFAWSGVHAVSAKKEWPDWTPPDDMLRRQPYLPHFVAGGPNNPLGARALYLGSTLYRIHGSNEPWTIGQNVSSGCIRMRNEDVIDLYDRVRIGSKVVVL